MKIDVRVVTGSKLVKVGYIEAEGFNADKCYELCNWERWSKVMPDNLHVDIGLHSRRICFTNPDTNEMWLTKSIGWFVGNEKEINEYINENKNEILWM